MDIPSMLDRQHKLRTVSAQPVVLKAIAKLYYDTFFGKNENLRNEENQNKLIDGLNDFDFSHTNPAWRYYILPLEQRAAEGLDGLSSYLLKMTREQSETLALMMKKAKHLDFQELITTFIR
jgi:hypothetical protein